MFCNPHLLLLFLIDAAVFLISEYRRNNVLIYASVQTYKEERRVRGWRCAKCVQIEKKGCKETQKTIQRQQRLPKGDVQLTKPATTRSITCASLDVLIIIIVWCVCMHASQPMKLSKALEDVTGPGPMGRTDVTRQVWVYIRKHDLQNPENRREILTDDTLAKVRGACLGEETRVPRTPDATDERGCAGDGRRKKTQYVPHQQASPTAFVAT